MNTTKFVLLLIAFKLIVTFHYLFNIRPRHLAIKDCKRILKYISVTTVMGGSDPKALIELQALQQQMMGFEILPVEIEISDAYLVTVRQNAYRIFYSYLSDYRIKHKSLEQTVLNLDQTGRFKEDYLKELARLGSSLNESFENLRELEEQLSGFTTRFSDLIADKPGDISPTSRLVTT